MRRDWGWTAVGLSLAVGCGGRADLRGGYGAEGANSAGRGGSAPSSGGFGGAITSAGRPGLAGGPVGAGSGGLGVGGGGFGAGGGMSGGAPTGAGFGGGSPSAGSGGAAGSEPLSARPVNVFAGTQSTCATMDDGGVTCWGANNAGELGNGSNVGSWQPVRVLGLPSNGAGVNWLSLGTSFACAVLSDNTARCWGAGGLGQLGDGMLTAKSSPVPVLHIDSQLNPAYMVSSGRYHSCVTSGTRAVECWGGNFDGQLGNGTTVNTVELSSAVLGTPNPILVGVAVGDSFSCLWLEDGTVRCWGDNSQYQLGNESTTDAANPVDVPLAIGSSNPLEQIAMGGNHACVNRRGDGVLCWGTDGASQYTKPTAIPFFAGATLAGLTAGAEHSCALLQDRTVWCWGAAAPIGQAAASAVPVAIAGLSPQDTGGAVVWALSAGNGHTCALMSDSTLYCWGDGRSGQLGVDGLQYSAKAVRVQAWQ